MGVQFLLTQAVHFRRITRLYSSNFCSTPTSKTRDRKVDLITFPLFNHLYTIHLWSDTKHQSARWGEGIEQSPVDWRVNLPTRTAEHPYLDMDKLDPTALRQCINRHEVGRLSFN
ncbi:hypothetical protein FRC18_001141 [Serendipita sp. 400]|nr:hypothetical protein FRC18_001141 [Serendipita sp. 400]